MTAARDGGSGSPSLTAVTEVPRGTDQRGLAPGHSCRRHPLLLRASLDLETQLSYPSRQDHPQQRICIRDAEPSTEGFSGQVEGVLASYTRGCFLPSPAKMRVCIPGFLTTAHHRVLLASLPHLPPRLLLVWDSASGSSHLQGICQLVAKTTTHKIQLSHLHNSAAFDESTMLFNHHHRLVPEYLHLSKGEPCAQGSQPIPPRPGPWQLPIGLQSPLL